LEVAVYPCCLAPAALADNHSQKMKLSNFPPSVAPALKTAACRASSQHQLTKSLDHNYKMKSIEANWLLNHKKKRRRNEK
jgi:hypothetical protein